MESYKIFIKNNIIAIIGHILICMKGIILVPILIRYVGVTAYGGYVLLVTIFGLIFGISSFGVSFRYRRSVSSEADRKIRQKLFYPQFSFQLLSLLFLSLAIIIIFPFFDNIFLKGDVVFSHWLIIPFLISCLVYSQSTDYFRYTNRVDYFTYATTLYSYLNIVTIFLFRFIIHDFAVDTLLEAEIFSAFLISFPLIIMMVREIGVRICLPCFSDLIADIRLGFPLIVGYIVDMILSCSDRYIIAAFISVTAVGYYTPAYALGSLVAFLPKAACVVLPPIMSNAVDSGKEGEARTMLDYTLKGYFLTAIPFVIGSYVLSKPLLNLFANEEVAKNAYGVTPVVAIGTLFYGLNLILSNVLFVRMKTSMMFNVNVLAALTNLLLNLLLLYFFKNILIAAITTSLSYFIAFIYIIRAIRSDWRISIPLVGIIKAVIASLIMGGALFVINIQFAMAASRLICVLSEMAIGITIYVVSLFFLKAFSYKEIHYLRESFS